MQRRLSRWMPPAPVQPLTRAGIIVLTAVAVSLLALFYFYPFFLTVVAGLVLLGVLLNAIEDRRLRRLAAERQGESICTFARAFNREASEFDPYIIRAVWEALEYYVSLRGGRVPLRPSDRLDEDLRIDWEDLDELVFREVAVRTGRSTDDTEVNPLYGDVSTVADLVHFLSFQPRRSAA